VNKKTRQAAIDVLTMDTETFTRVQRESSDSDDNGGLSALIDTETRTFTEREQSDDDNDRRSIQALMDTTTITESREDVDQDQDHGPHDFNNHS
jgi:hypothetical protein